MLLLESEGLFINSLSVHINELITSPFSSSSNRCKSTEHRLRGEVATGLFSSPHPLSRGLVCMGSGGVLRTFAQKFSTP